MRARSEYAFVLTSAYRGACPAFPTDSSASSSPSASGVAFAVQPVVGQLALDGGASIASVLGWRYALAAIVLGVLARKGLARMRLRTALLAFTLGLGLYAADSALFYASLERTSAPFATLLHYAHLVVVVGAAALLGRERLDARRVAALVGVLLGVVLVSGGGTPDALGIALALGSAAAYAAYILVSDRLLARRRPDGLRGAADGRRRDRVPRLRLGDRPARPSSAELPEPPPS